MYDIIACMVYTPRVAHTLRVRILYVSLHTFLALLYPRCVSTQQKESNIAESCPDGVCAFREYMYKYVA